MTKQTLNKTASTASNEKYTEQQTNEILSAWKSFTESNPKWDTDQREKTDKFIEDLAAKYQKKVRSIIGKLTRHNVYKAKTSASKKGGSQTKQEIAESIGAVLRLSEPETNSLTVAGKTALEKIFAALANSKPIDPMTPAERETKQLLIDKLTDEISLASNTLADLPNLSNESLHNLYESVEGFRAEYEKNLHELQELRSEYEEQLRELDA